MFEIKDTLLSIAGLLIILYGGQTTNLLLTVSGIVPIILNIVLFQIHMDKKIQDNNKEITILKAQINTKRELNNIWRELNEIKKQKSSN